MTCVSRGFIRGYSGYGSSWARGRSGTACAGVGLSSTRHTNRDGAAATGRARVPVVHPSVSDVIHGEFIAVGGDDDP